MARSIWGARSRFWEANEGHNKCNKARESVTVDVEVVDVAYKLCIMILSRHGLSKDERVCTEGRNKGKIVVWDDYDGHCTPSEKVSIEHPTEEQLEALKVVKLFGDQIRLLEGNK